MVNFNGKTTDATYTFSSYPPSKDEILERLFKAGFITMQELKTLLGVPDYHYVLPSTPITVSPFTYPGDEFKTTSK